MDKAELVREIYERQKSKVTMKDLSTVVDEAFAIMTEKLHAGEAISIAGFGTFDLKKNAIKTLDQFAGSNGKARRKT